MTRYLRALWLRWDIYHVEMWTRACEREGLDTTSLRKYLNAQRCALALIGEL